jgi:hypothetical protein
MPSDLASSLSEMDVRNVALAAKISFARLGETELKRSPTLNSVARTKFVCSMCNEKCASSEGWHEQWVKVPPG